MPGFVIRCSPAPRPAFFQRMRRYVHRLEHASVGRARWLDHADANSVRTEADSQILPIQDDRGRRRRTLRPGRRAHTGHLQADHQAGRAGRQLQYRLRVRYAQEQRLRRWQGWHLPLGWPYGRAGDASPIAGHDPAQSGSPVLPSSEPNRQERSQMAASQFGAWTYAQVWYLVSITFGCLEGRAPCGGSGR